MDNATQPKDARAFWPHVVALALLFVALSQTDSAGFYSILRWVVCAAFLLLAMEAHQRDKDRWAWIWGVLAGIYNPIVPVHASKDLWIVVDLIAIAITAFDLLVKHESLSKSRQSLVIIFKWCTFVAFRLVIVAAAMVMLFFVLDFVITRWG